MTIIEAKALINCDQLNTAQPQTWFDLGCGGGLFSEALIGLLSEGSLIYSIDKQPTTLNKKRIKFLQLDFVCDRLPEVSVNGVLMANSLHYVEDKLQVLAKIKKHLLPNGVFLLVEYDIETANRWVPYPTSFLSAKDLFRKAGFDTGHKITERPSVLNGRRMYSLLFF
jgi:ubiquinone/menaquinone biosynthesis C-methylase UbiE